MRTFDTVPNSKLKQWKPRQRRKLRVGEYQEFLFTFELSLKEELSEDEFNGFIKSFYDFLEQHQLNAATFSDVATPLTMSGVVQFEGRGSVTNEHRTLVIDWLNAQALIAECIPSELVDAWHGWE